MEVGRSRAVVSAWVPVQGYDWDEWRFSRVVKRIDGCLNWFIRAIDQEVIVESCVKGTPSLVEFAIRCA